MGLAVNNVTLAKKLTQKSEIHRQKSADDSWGKERAKKAKIKAKKDVLAVYKCYTVNNSPKITPKKWNSQPKRCVDICI